MIAAVRWAEYQTQITKQHGVFESSSRQRLMNAVLLYVMQRGRAQRSRLLYVGLFSPIICTVVVLVFGLHCYGPLWLRWFDWCLKGRWFKRRLPASVLRQDIEPEIASNGPRSAFMAAAVHWRVNVCVNERLCEALWAPLRCRIAPCTCSPFTNGGYNMLVALRVEATQVTQPSIIASPALTVVGVIKPIPTVSGWRQVTSCIAGPTPALTPTASLQLPYSVFGLWEEAGAPGEDPRIAGEHGNHIHDSGIDLLAAEASVIGTAPPNETNVDRPHGLKGNTKKLLWK